MRICSNQMKIEMATPTLPPRVSAHFHGLIASFPAMLDVSFTSSPFITLPCARPTRFSLFFARRAASRPRGSLFLLATVAVLAHVMTP